MSVDMQMVGEITARLMDRVDSMEMEGVVSAVALIVAIDNGEHTLVTLSCSEPQPYKQRGLLAEAMDAVIESSRHGPPQTE